MIPDQLIQFLQAIHIQKLGINWLDIVIGIVLLLYGIEGYFIGFFASLVDFASFILSFVFAVKLYNYASLLLLRFFTIPQGFAKVIGFFAVAFLSEILISFILRKLLQKGLALANKTK